MISTKARFEFYLPLFILR